jgi:hypothetical protein
MKASTFSDAQKAFILKQGADGMPVADIRKFTALVKKQSEKDVFKPLFPDGGIKAG